MPRPVSEGIRENERVEGRSRRNLPRHHRRLEEQRNRLPTTAEHFPTGGFEFIEIGCHTGIVTEVLFFFFFYFAAHG